MNDLILPDLMRLLVVLRTDLSMSSDLVAGIKLGRCYGFTTALHVSGLISLDEWFRLDKLVESAFAHAREPFPSAANAGPVEPANVRLERAKKPQPEVAQHDDPGQLSADHPHAGLRLLCVLVKSRFSAPRRLPVHTLSRLHAPWRAVSGRWPVVLPDGLLLRETHAVQASAEVLERCLRQRQAHAFRTGARTVRAGALSHV